MREDNADIWGKNVPGRGISQCKGPEIGVCLACPRDRKEANENGMECVGREDRRDYTGT